MNQLLPHEIKYIRENSAEMYISDIAKDLGLNHTIVYNYVRKHGMEQKKVMSRRKRAKAGGKGKIVKGYFNVDAKYNWVI